MNVQWWRICLSACLTSELMEKFQRNFCGSWGSCPGISFICSGWYGKCWKLCFCYRSAYFYFTVIRTFGISTSGWFLQNFGAFAFIHLRYFKWPTCPAVTLCHIMFMFEIKTTHQFEPTLLITYRRSYEVIIWIFFKMQVRALKGFSSNFKLRRNSWILRFHTGKQFTNGWIYFNFFRCHFK